MEKMKTEKYEISGMTCSSCVAHVEKSVKKLEGIQQVQVNLLTNSMTVSYDENAIDNKAIEKSVEDAGYQAHKHIDSQAGNKNNSKTDYIQIEQDELKSRCWLSFTFLIPLLYLSMGHMLGLPLPDIFIGHENALIFAFTQLLLTFPIALINRKYFIKGFKTLMKGAPNMDSLIAIGSSASIVYGIFAIFGIGYGLGHNETDIVKQFSHDLYFESGAVILTLITLGKYLEARSKSGTLEAITRLIDLAPKTAMVLTDGIENEIPVEDLKKGDVIVVRSGQSVPTDGIILTGNGNLDESALTGESMSVYKEAGGTVLSASINKNGYFTFRATKVGNETTLSQIIRLVEEASASKAPVSKLADKISGIFVPVVILIAVISTIAWLISGYPFDFALSIGVAVLVISCPCALGLATPVAIMVGTGKAAEHGILFKSAESLETAHKIDTVVLDKTGTLTQGKPRITDIITNEQFTENELLRIVYSLELYSEHSIAEAIINEAEIRNLKPLKIENFETFVGRGVKATIGEDDFIAGNLLLMNEKQIQFNDFATVTNDFAAQGKTPLLIAKNSRVTAVIAIADVLKENSIDAVTQLQQMGMEVIMLTGDHIQTAQYIQNQTGITKVVAELLPQDKEKEIALLQKEGKIVAMVGDGINDAPALARANLGIAIGAGTDIAMDSADVVLMKSDLSDIAVTLQLGKSVMINIRQNLFWAFFYNIIGIPLAAGAFYLSFGWKLNPMLAAAAMSFSSVTVVLNALRLLKFKPDIKSHTHREIENQENQNITSGLIQSNFYKSKNINIMTNKTLKISGMSCGHCSARVEKTLNNIDGVEAKVDLESNTATITLSKEVSNETIVKAVDNIGYEVTEITE